MVLVNIPNVPNLWTFGNKNLVVFVDARKYKHYLVDACGDLFHFSYTTYNNFIDFMEAFLYNLLMVLLE